MKIFSLSRGRCYSRLELSEGSWTRGLAGIGAADAEGICVRMGRQLMLRRVLAITVISVALSAAGTLAFAPSLSRVSRAWTRGIAWSARGFTPVPRLLDSAAMTRDPSFANEGGVPGTYCPVRPRDPNMSVVPPDQRMSTEPARSSSAIGPAPGRTDLLAAPAMCNAVAPETTRATPSPRAIVP
jgi:hypothetical protein